MKFDAKCYRPLLCFCALGILFFVVACPQGETQVPSPVVIPTVGHKRGEGEAGGTRPIPLRSFDGMPVPATTATLGVSSVVAGPPVASSGATSPTLASACVEGVGRQEAYVVRVIDGDTIEVEAIRRYTVRYIGVDTPETKHPDRPIGCFGREAAEANRSLVERKMVCLERDVSETDRYGRLLRYVYLRDGTFVNAWLVGEGYAQVATYPPDVKYADLFLQLQHQAREAGRGLWGRCP